MLPFYNVDLFYMVSGAQPGFFRGREGFLEWGHLDKTFMCDKQKKGPGKILVFFLQDALKIAF